MSLILRSCLFSAVTAAGLLCVLSGLHADGTGGASPGPAAAPAAGAAPSSPASAGSGPPPHIRWEYGHPSRHANGPAVAELHLVSSDGSEMEDASWFYRAHPLAGYRELPSADAPPVMRGGGFGAGVAEAGGYAGAGDPSPSVFRLGEEGKRGPAGGLKLVVASGRYAMADVMGTALLHGRRCYAQTTVLLMGDSMEGSPAESNAADPRWPSFAFRGSGDLFWPQTGQAFDFTVRDGKVAGPITAWRGRSRVPGEYAPLENGTSFTPAHDPELSAQSVAATLPVTMVAATPDGGALSYTFYVHRSRYAGTDMPMGIAVLSSAFLATGLGILAVRTRRRSQRHALEAV